MPRRQPVAPPPAAEEVEESEEEEIDLGPVEPVLTRRQLREMEEEKNRPRRGVREKKPKRFADEMEGGDGRPIPGFPTGKRKKPASKVKVIRGASEPAAKRPKGAVSEPAKRPKVKVPKIVIVGGGYAGVSAARSLVDQGYDVIILEARERLGGRVHSMVTKGITIELGAAVLMGVQGGNPLAAQCRKYGVKMRTLDNSCPLHDIDGSLLPPNTDQKAEQLFNKLLDKATEERGATTIQGDPPVGTRLLLNSEKIPGKQWHVRVVETRGRKLKLHYDGWNNRCRAHPLQRACGMRPLCAQPPHALSPLPRAPPVAERAGGGVATGQRLAGLRLPPMLASAPFSVPLPRANLHGTHLAVWLAVRPFLDGGGGVAKSVGPLG